MDLIKCVCVSAAPGGFERGRSRASDWLVFFTIKLRQTSVTIHRKQKKEFRKERQREGDREGEMSVCCQHLFPVLYKLWGPASLGNGRY